MFKAVPVTNKVSATELETALNKGYRISRTDPIEGGILFLLIDEEKYAKENPAGQSPVLEK